MRKTPKAAHKFLAWVRLDVLAELHIIVGPKVLSKVASKEMLLTSSYQEIMEHDTVRRAVLTYESLYPPVAVPR